MTKKSKPIRPPYLGIEFQTELWRLINDYAEACGGKPDKFVYGNTRRSDAVAKIMELLSEELPA